MNRKSATAGALLLFLLFVLLAYGFYNSLTSRVPGANDFYSRWYGARALFFYGQNPYSAEVTRGIQMGMLGRLAKPEEDQVAFAYPLYVAFMVLPLVGLAYAQAQALWMAALLISLIAAALVILQMNRVRLSPGLLVLVVFGILSFYPSARALLLGQFAIVSFLFLALACWAIVKHQDTAGGVFLALATVKPQTAALLVPCIIGWALMCKRWRLAGSILATLGGLTALACVWLPTWPLEFVSALSRYTGYIRVGAPVQTLLSYFVPLDLAGPSAVALGGLLVFAAAAAWLNASDDFLPAFNLTAVVTTWTAIRIGSSDQVLLLFPWIVWLVANWRHGSRPFTVLAAAALIVVPWVVFLSTIHGDAEDPVVTLVLPILTLVPYAINMLGRGDWSLRRKEAR